MFEVKRFTGVVRNLATGKSVIFRTLKETEHVSASSMLLPEMTNACVLYIVLSAGIFSYSPMISKYVFWDDNWTVTRIHEIFIPKNDGLMNFLLFHLRVYFAFGGKLNL